jgi:hypothetical protein
MAPHRRTGVTGVTRGNETQEGAIGILALGTHRSEEELHVSVTPEQQADRHAYSRAFIDFRPDSLALILRSETRIISSVSRRRRFWALFARGAYRAPAAQYKVIYLCY